MSKHKPRTKKESILQTPKIVASSKPTAQSKRSFTLWIIIAGVLVLLIVAVFIVPSLFSPRKKITANQYNLLVITLDTVRADHIGAYGYQKALTPNLDRLAHEGVMFQNCFTPVPLTLPAHCSIFTGKYTLGHGVRGNGSYNLPDKEVTLAETMKENGYSTFAVISSFVLLAKFGLQQGFDFFDDSLNSHKMYNNYTSEIVASEVFNKFAQWFVKNYQSQFFAWIHLYDAHEPYNPPHKYIKKLGSSPMQRYDGEIAFVDEAVGKIIDALQKKGVLEKTLVVIMGDHGEGFGEHHEFGHGIFCYNETLKVPLIFFNPVLFPKASKVILDPVNLVDVYPTLVELFGFRTQPSVQGKSLVPLLGGQEEQASRLFYFESLHGRDEMNWAPPMGVIDGDLKFINLPEPELYNLQNDPAEKDNLFWKKNMQARELDKKLAQQITLLSKGVVAGEAQRELTTEDKNHLTTLGYISSFASKSNVQLDPKKGIVVDNQVKQIYALLNDAKLVEAEKLLNEVIAANATNPLAVFYDLKQQLYTRQKRSDLVVATLQEALQKYPRIERFYILLAFELNSMGKIAETQEICVRLLKLNPNFTRAYILLGEIAERQQDVLKATGYYKKALDIEPQNISLKLKYAELMLLQQNMAVAMSIYDELLERQEVANNAEFLFKVALLNLQQGNAPKSEMLLARVVSIEPRGKYYFTYAMALFKNEKVQEALNNMELALTRYASDLTPQQIQTAESAVKVWRTALTGGK